jgi:hypothetical protein
LVHRGNGALVAVALASRLLADWGQPLLAHHAIRQTQTAISIYWYVKEGIDFLRPPLPLYGPDHPSNPFEFPLYQAAVAALLRLVGRDSLDAVEVASRLVNFISFLVAGALLHRMVYRQIDRLHADVALVIWLVLPFAYFWSLTSMIEFTALALALASLDQTIRLAERPEGSGPSLWLAGLWGSLAYLCKATTMAAFAPAALFGYLHERNLLRTWRPKRRDTAALVIAFALPVLVGYAWTHWAAHVRAGNVFLQAGADPGRLATWILGTPDQRLDPVVWKQILGQVSGLQILGVIGVPIAILGLWAIGRQAVIFWLLPVVFSFLVFTNLYYRHDYYQIATLPGVVVLLAAGVVAICRYLRTGSTVQRTVWPTLLAFAIAGSVWVVHAPARHFFSLLRGQPPLESTAYTWSPLAGGRPTPELAVAAAIREYSSPGDTILLADSSAWSEIPFYAERKAMLLNWPCRADLWRQARTVPTALFVESTDRPWCFARRDAHCTVAEVAGYWIGRCYVDTLGDGGMPPE